jgi:glycosyltransferase involved in cell wall biosynthesis
MINPQLSIFVPTREHAEVLRETLAALVALGLKQVEFVICDNCSSDETVQVVSAYSDSSIRYVRSGFNAVAAI